MNISRKMSWIVIVSSLLILLPAMFIFYQIGRAQLLENELSQLKYQIQTLTDGFSADINIATTNLSKLESLINRKIQSADQYDMTRFESRMMLLDDGVWRNNPNEFNGLAEPGLFLPNDFPHTDALKRFYGEMMNIFESFGASSINETKFFNIWFLDHDRGELIFDAVNPDFIYQMTADTDYRSTDWMTLASPSLNPERETKWTTALFDPVPEAWIISAIRPLDIDGEWVGTLGQDMQLSTLFKLLNSVSGKFENVQHFLRDARGNFLLAGKWQQQLEQQTKKFSIDPSESDLLVMLSKPFADNAMVMEAINVDGKQHQAIAINIKPMDWTYLYIVPTEDITAPLVRILIGATLILLMTVLLISVLIQTSVRNIIAKPIQRLVEHTNLLAQGKKAETVDSWGSSELTELGQALELMHGDLQEETRRLSKSEARYRDSEVRYKNVVNNIREVLVQVDQKHCWHFLSPAWQDLTGYEPLSCLSQQAVSYFFYGDQKKLNDELAALFLGEKDSWTGEVRLLTKQQQLIWVQLSLQTVTDEHFVVGTIENFHINYLSREINNVVRSAEQMVLASESSLWTLLDFVAVRMAATSGISLFWILVKKGQNETHLFKSGQQVDFLYENASLWTDVLADDSPVSTAITERRVERISDNQGLPDNWQQRLDDYQLKDSVFIPFDPGYEYSAVIGAHSDQESIFNQAYQSILSDFASALTIICHLTVEQHLMRMHRSAVENSVNAIMVTDLNHNIQWVNHAFEKLTLYKLDDIQGRNPEFLFPRMEVNERYREVVNQIEQGHIYQQEAEKQRKDGVFFTIDESIIPVLNQQGNIMHFVTVMHDITERKLAEQRIAYMATHDELTLLPNRNLLNDRLESAIRKTQKQNTKLAVLFIDLDQFKIINDSQGHQFGDNLLKSVAERLSQELRSDDVIARFGGDEFVVILTDIDEISSVSQIAEKLLFVIKQTYFIDGHELNITGSIGISLCPDDAESTEELIKNADSAMYQSKSLGRNAFQFYTQDIHDQIIRKIKLEDALHKAIDEQQLILHYQPFVHLESKQIRGFEALIRWQHPEFGLIPPDEFIPLAEETGMIIDIGNWVMKQACTQMKTWLDTYPWLRCIAINVSTRQLQQDNFIEEVTSIFKESGLDATKVDLEVTESSIMENIDSAIDLLTEVRNLGVMVSIDDFGTGYSSLSYLKQLPADYLKIDRSFVSQLSHEGTDKAIVKSILALADNLGLRVIAEGIEDAYQDEVLTKMRCHFAQGYYFSRPIPSEQATDLLDEQHQQLNR